MTNNTDKSSNRRNKLIPWIWGIGALLCIIATRVVILLPLKESDPTRTTLLILTFLGVIIMIAGAIFYAYKHGPYFN
jgi:predicted membrane channel-forming protein YqfA (hemolysin III family)